MLFLQQPLEPLFFNPHYTRPLSLKNGCFEMVHKNAGGRSPGGGDGGWGINLPGWGGGFALLGRGRLALLGRGEGGVDYLPWV